MNDLKKYIFNLYAIDLLVIAFATFLTVLNLVFYSKVEQWIYHIFFNTLFTILIFFIANIDARKNSNLWKQIHYWYILPIIFMSFKEIYFMVKPIAGADCDSYLIAIDNFIFGVNPNQFLNRYSHPLLTEILQIAYSSFFFLPLILLFELQFRKKTIQFEFAAFTLILGFILSYIGYFLVPAVGPRFTLFDFNNTNIELPGLWLTNYLREIINAGESVPHGTVNPIEIVQRDVFPSGHTQMTLIVIFFSALFKTKLRYIIYIFGLLLIFATVYLRYHYVIDVIGGIVFMIATLYMAKPLFNKWRKLINKELFDYRKQNG